VKRGGEVGEEDDPNKFGNNRHLCTVKDIISYEFQKKFSTSLVLSHFYYFSWIPVPQHCSSPVFVIHIQNTDDDEHETDKLTPIAMH